MNDTLHKINSGAKTSCKRSEFTRVNEDYSQHPVVRPSGLPTAVAKFDTFMSNLCEQRRRQSLNLFYAGYKVRIAGIVRESIVDGPGLRYVIFTQGCPHKCVGCHNPQSHDYAGGSEITLAKLLSAILETKLLDGVTFSGGEPFVQAAACAKLAQAIKETRDDLNILVYSGYYYKELLAMAKKDSAVAELLRVTDILIDGPYDITKRTYDLPFRGSSNQSIIELR